MRDGFTGVYINSNERSNYSLSFLWLVPRQRDSPFGSIAPRPAPVTRFDRRLNEILGHATEVFCKKGYEGASMRDLSRASGMSLAGIYYYFESKERLLFLIQKHTFTTIVQRLKDAAATA